MKLKIFILLSVCFVARAQTPPTNQVSAATNREALRRAVRSLGTNAPTPALAAVPTNANRNLPPVPAAPAPAQVRPRINAPPAPTAAPPSATPVLQPAPPQPGPATAVAGTNLMDIPDADVIIPAATINFPAVDIDQVLPIYAELVNRTILRASTLPAGKITLKTQTPLTKREAIDALNAVLGMNGVAMINIGDKFVKAVPSPQGGQAGAKLNRDDPSAFGELGGYVTHVTQTKFAKPTELVPILQPFASAGVGVGIQAIDSSQILVLRDYTENIKRMLELIKEIDIVPTSEFVSEVIPIKYALAEDILSALNGLSSGGGGASIGRSGASGLPAPTSGALVGGTSYRGGVNQPGTINRSPTTPGGAVAPGGAAAPSFSERLQGIISRAAKATGAGDFQILGQTKIIADSRTNSLLIFASKQDMETIKDIISKLDVVLAQVLIEAIIMEVSLDDQRTVGFSYLQHQKTAGLFTGAGALKNVPFLNPENFVISGSDTNGALAPTANSLPGGFSYAATLNNDLDVTVQALSTDGRVNVLSRPRIQTSHAVPASLFIGNTVPYITGTSFNDFGGIGARSQYQEKRVGITLDVLPLINSEGLVVMDIQQNIQQLGTPTTIDGNPVPTTTERSASAKVAVRNHDTIILGGFISSSKSKTKSGVPFLKDIPLLGYLFRSTSDSNQRVELIVMIRPTVLPTPEAASLAATAERDKLPGVHRAQIEYEKDEADRLKKFESGYKKELQKEKENQKGSNEFQPVEGIR